MRFVVVLFYRRPNVRATVEAVDAVPRWTDDVPLPLLIFGLWMLSGAFCMMFFGSMYTALPAGPWMLRGVSALSVVLAMAGVMLFIGLGSLKRMRAAWWTALALLVVGSVVVYQVSRVRALSRYYERRPLPR